MAKLLIAENVFKSYKDKKVLAGLDLTIEPGKIYGLIGRNGVGKTTLLGILTAQNTMDSGSVSYGSEPVWENRTALDDLCFSRELSSTSYSGQNTYKIQWHLKAAADFYPRWDMEYAERLISVFGLDKKKKLNTLSKGQMSMVAIVIALASRAPITILDEPVAGLDVVMREKFYSLLLEDHMETGRTFIVSTHIIEEAASIFEEVIIMDEGKIIEKANTEELISQFASISGHEDEVEKAVEGLEVLSRYSMGRRMTAVVRGTNPCSFIRADVDVAPLNLQKVFVALCGHGAEM